jgi:hypothetical protein
MCREAGGCSSSLSSRAICRLPRWWPDPPALFVDGFELERSREVRVVENDHDGQGFDRPFEIGECAVKSGFKLLVRHVVPPLHDPHRDPLFRRFR